MIAIPSLRIRNPAPRRRGPGPSRPGAAFPGLCLGAVLALSGCGGDQEAAAGGGGFQPPPTPVETAAVASETVVDRFEAVGTIEAAEAITVVSEIAAVVRRLPFREGDLVKRGALLAQLDADELRADLMRAQALQDQKQAAFDRIDPMVQRGAATPQDLDNARAELRIAEAEVAQARARLGKSRITAPFGGRVGPRRVSPGAFLQPGTAITDLAQLDRIKVSFTAPERFVPRLRRGASVLIRTPAYPGESLTGTLHVVSPVLDTETRSVAVIARAGNPGERFRPGMSANVSVVLSERLDALTIPAEAVLTEGTQTLVFRVNPDSTVMKTPVELGLRMPGKVEVVSGLEPGDQVVRAGHQKLFPGARIHPVTSRPPAPEGNGAGS